MSFTDFMWLKLIVLIVIVFFVNLIFTAITGRSIEQVRRDREAAAPVEKQER